MRNGYLDPCARKYVFYLSDFSFKFTLDFWERFKTNVVKDINRKIKYKAMFITIVINCKSTDRTNLRKPVVKLLFSVFACLTY
jgi:hypothetical protein